MPHSPRVLGPIVQRATEPRPPSLSQAKRGDNKKKIREQSRKKSGIEEKLNKVKLSGSFRNGTMARPSVEAVGDGEIEAEMIPSAFDEDGASFVRLGVGWNFKLQACVPDCVHGAVLTSRLQNGASDCSYGALNYYMFFKKLSS